MVSVRARAPIATRYFKECVRNALYPHLAEARAKELEASNIVWATEDAKEGLANVIRGKKTVFKGK
jgi:enoyl-CoA hydratase/carnithine racemase